MYDGAGLGFRTWKQQSKPWETPSNSEAVEVTTDLEKGIQKNQSKPEKEEPWSGQAGLVGLQQEIPTTIFLEHEEDPWNGQAAGYELQQEIPTTTFQENQPGHGLPARVSTDVEQVVLGRLRIDSIENQDSVLAIKVVTDSQRVYSSYGRVGADNDRSPGEDVENVPTFCTKKRGIWSVVLLVFVIMVVVVALKLLKPDPHRK